MDAMTDLVPWLRAQLDEDERVAPTAAIVMATRSSTAEIGIRLMAEINAKRRILDDYGKALDRRKQHPDDVASAAHLLAMLHVIKLLALPYAERPGYLEDWRPSGLPV